jgi:hypothetical protein
MLNNNHEILNMLKNDAHNQSGACVSYKSFAHVASPSKDREGKTPSVGPRISNRKSSPRLSTTTPITMSCVCVRAQARSELDSR